MTKQNQGYVFRYSASQAKLARILDLLQEPMTRADLAEAVGLSVRGVQSYLSMLMAEETRRIHVQGWQPNSPGSPSAIYVAGPGKDKRRPKAMTPGERSKKRYRCAEFAIDQMQIGRMKRMKMERDPMTAALFGAA